MRRIRTYESVDKHFGVSTGGLDEAASGNNATKSKPSTDGISNPLFISLDQISEAETDEDSVKSQKASRRETVGEPFKNTVVEYNLKKTRRRSMVDMETMATSAHRILPNDGYPGNKNDRRKSLGVLHQPKLYQIHTTSIPGNLRQLDENAVLTIGVNLSHEHRFKRDLDLNTFRVDIPEEGYVERTIPNRSSRLSSLNSMPRRTSKKHRLSFSVVDQRTTLKWNGINVFIPAKKQNILSKILRKPPHKERQILNDVSGVVEPGTLLAILGASGSGKSTLLNVLTSRYHDLRVEGTVQVNNKKIGKDMPRISGYVQQYNLFIGTLTVKEHLWFHSMLRMDSDVPDILRKRRIKAVISDLGLKDCANTVIGIPGYIKGISGGEKKRLAFASEVLTNPPLLFCDEPTSGLDSYRAQNVVQTLKAMTTKGRTVLCTIHQPSSGVFAIFDRVLILAAGKVGYFGKASHALTFFKMCGHPCPTNFNPADHYIHTVAVRPGEEQQCQEVIKRICSSYKESVHAEKVRQSIREEDPIEEFGETVSNILSSFLALEFVGMKTYTYMQEDLVITKYQSPYMASWWRQFIVLFWRNWLNAARQPEIFKSRFAQALALGLLFGLLYYPQSMDQDGVRNISGAIYLMQLQLTITYMYCVVAAFPLEFPTFVKEHRDGMYRVDTYFFSKTFAELPQFVVIPVAFCVPMYWLVGMYPSASAFIISLITQILACNVALSFGYAVAVLTDSIQVNMAIAPVLFMPLVAVGGIYLSSKTVPDYLFWLKYISLYTYSNEILMVNQWSGVDNIVCDVREQRNVSVSPYNYTELIQIPCVRTGQEILDVEHYSQDNISRDFLLLLTLFVGFRVIALLLLLFRVRNRSQCC